MQGLLKSDARQQEWNAQAGFSLVELALSVVVIGVLLGFVVGGVAVLDHSRISATITQIDSIKKAVSGFYEVYHAMPGDLDRARSVLDNCTSTMFCDDGDGNGAIGTGSSLNHDWDESVIDDDETRYAWRHLALSELLPRASGRGDTLIWGNSHPASPLGGGVELYYDSNHSFLGYSFGGGHYLRFSSDLSTADLDDDEGTLALYALAIDRKIDDGNPFSGSVTAAGSSAGDCYEGTDLDEGYNRGRLGRADCFLFVKLGAR